MIGEKVIHKLMMTGEDGHYVGNLVNGTRMLDFFGDVPLGQMAGFLRMVFALSIGLNVLFGGCFYVGSNFILSRKLNLE